MPKSRPKYKKKLFESDLSSSDVSANLYLSMLISPAWRDLTPQQQRLYTYCKLQLYAQKRKPDDDPAAFYMNKAKWSDTYQLYKRSNARGFYHDMAALIEHGFIVCVKCGATTRKRSVYKFSSMWQQYGTEAFTVSPSEMTRAMLNKLP